MGRVVELAFQPRSASQKEQMEKGLASALVIRWPVPLGWRRELDRTRAEIHDGQGLKDSINRSYTEAQDQLLQIITFGLQRAAGPY
jgi:hypothetical protein